MRERSTIPARVKELSKEANRQRVHRGYLAEDYDGIGQYIMVILARSSTSGALRARVASADFGTGKLIPRGSPVSVFIAHGKIEIMSMGYKP